MVNIISYCIFFFSFLHEKSREKMAKTCQKVSIFAKKLQKNRIFQGIRTIIYFTLFIYSAQNGILLWFFLITTIIFCIQNRVFLLKYATFLTDLMVNLQKTGDFSEFLGTFFPKKSKTLYKDEPQTFDPEKRSRR